MSGYDGWAAMTARQRKLGTVQQDVLAALQRHGSWSHHGGWLWDTISGTKRVLDSLVRAGHVFIVDGVYRPITPRREEE